MASHSFARIYVIVMCIMISKEVFSAGSVARPKDGHNNKWVSRILSDHVWDHRIASETNPECTRHFDIYLQNLSNLTTWAVQMFDSSDLVPRGILVGDTYKLGNFEECIKTEVPKEFGFTAQYCLPTIKFDRKSSETSLDNISDWERPVWHRIQMSKHRTKAPKDLFNLAFCIPSSCFPDDLKFSLVALLKGPMRDEGYNLNVSLNSLQCTTKEDIPGSNGSFIFRYFIVGITCVVVFCSTADLLLAVVRNENYDIINYPIAKATGVEKWILPFSVLRNAHQLMTPPNSPDDYKILHGIKAVLSLLTIWGHFAILACVGPLINWNYFENKLTDSSIFIVVTMFPIVDIFFCVSGFLSCMSMTKQLEKNTFNVWTHIANRLIRVVPPYIFVMACTMFVLPHLGNGPLWKSIVQSEVDSCRRGWWRNLLFINNYYELGDWCLPHSYYAAADMHFFIVGSVLAYLCWRWKSHQVAILVSAIFFSFLFPFLSVIINRYEGVLKLYHDFLSNSRSNEMLVQLYMKSHHRFGGYVTGIAGAFLLKHLQRKSYTFSKIASWIGVLVGFFIMFAISAVRLVLHRPSTPYSVVQHALYAGLNAQLICSGIMIIVIIQVTTGFGDLNPIFLAHDIFLPFSRLSYWTFHLNVPVITFLTASLKTPMHMTHEEMIFGGQNWGVILLTYCVAIYCYMIVEAPINHIKPFILRYIPRTRLPSRTKSE